MKIKSVSLSVTTLAYYRHLHCQGDSGDVLSITCRKQFQSCQQQGLSGARPKIHWKEQPEGHTQSPPLALPLLTLARSFLPAPAPWSLIIYEFPFVLPFDQLGRKNLLSLRAEGGESPAASVRGL